MGLLSLILDLEFLLCFIFIFSQLSTNGYVYLSKFEDFKQLNSNNENQLNNQVHTVFTVRKISTSKTFSVVGRDQAQWSCCIYMYTCKYEPTLSR